MKAPEQYYGTGKRKTSIARVYVRPGNGQILVNKKSLDDYFGQEAHRVLVRQPLVLTENRERCNIKVNVRGCGTSGQAGAIRHGISRALSLLPQENIRAILKKAGLLTRDAREVERKKYGQPGARKRFQYSKR